MAKPWHRKDFMPSLDLSPQDAKLYREGVSIGLKHNPHPGEDANEVLVAGWLEGISRAEERENGHDPRFA